MCIKNYKQQTKDMPMQELFYPQISELIGIYQNPFLTKAFHIISHDEGDGVVLPYFTRIIEILVGYRGSTYMNILYSNLIGRN